MDGDDYDRGGYPRDRRGWDDPSDADYAPRPQPSRELAPARVESSRAQPPHAQPPHELVTVEPRRESTLGKLRRKRKNMPLWQELPLLLVVAFCLAVLIRTFLLQAFYIPSGSMEETLQVGDRVLVNKVIYELRSPRRGEIVVFQGTDSWAPENQADTNIGFFAELGRTLGDLVGMSRPGEKDFIKRVIGMPGDVVACCDVNGRVTVNGYPLNEPYVTGQAPLIDEPSGPRDCQSRRFDPVTVEPGQMFVMGDNRLVSRDSRCQGMVPIENVIGRAFVILWPSGRWDGLSVPSTFDDVPKPFALPAEPFAPATPPGGLVYALPLFTSSWVTARSRLNSWRGGRRLAE